MTFSAESCSLGGSGTSPPSSSSSGFVGAVSNASTLNYKHEQYFAKVSEGQKSPVHVWIKSLYGAGERQAFHLDQSGAPFVQLEAGPGAATNRTG